MQTTTASPCLCLCSLREPQHTSTPQSHPAQWLTTHTSACGPLQEAHRRFPRTSHRNQCLPLYHGSPLLHHGFLCLHRPRTWRRWLRRSEPWPRSRSCRLTTRLQALLPRDSIVHLEMNDRRVTLTHGRHAGTQTQTNMHDRFFSTSLLHGGLTLHQSRPARRGRPGSQSTR